MMEKVELGTIASFSQGQQVSISDQKTEQFEGCDTFLRIINYTQNSHEYRFIPKQNKKYYVTNDDIIMVRYGAVGFVGRGLSGVLANNMFKVNYDKAKVDGEYLYRTLWSNVAQIQLLNASQSTSMAALNFKTVSKIKIPLPPLEEQKRIAAILDAADEVRQKNKALIKKYNQLTQSLFLDMFGDPVTNPKGWEKVYLKVLCNFNKTNVKPEEIKEGDIYIGLECIEKKTGKITNKFIVSSGEIKSNKFRFDSSYILYCKLRPYLNKVACPEFEGVCSTDIIPLRPKLDKSTKEFITSLLRGSWFVSFANERSSGANLPRISPNEVQNYQAINPPILLQNQFAERVQAIEAQKSKAEASLKKSEELFNALLQIAFKGELTN